MTLDPHIAAHVAEVARSWAESTTDRPLVIRKDASGAVCLVAAPRERFTQQQFAEELGMSVNTFKKRVRTELGMEPAGDGCYAADTVEQIKRLLKLQERGRVGSALRKAERQKEAA